MLKKLKVIAVLSCILLLFTACSSGQQSAKEGEEGSSSNEKSAEKITLKLASIQPETHTLTQNFFKPFMERVEELTDGQVQFEFYPAEQLGKAADYLDLTKDGVMDVAYYLSTYYPSNMPINANMFGLPGMYQSAEDGVALHTISQQEPMLTTDFLNNGVRPVANFLVSPYQFFTTGKEVRVPEDLKGEKVRAPGGIAKKSN
jgi:TRAP-type C4-dicarboxylate transport system substrate-binding protein